MKPKSQLNFKVLINALFLVILSGCGAVSPEAPDEMVIQEVLPEEDLSTINIPIKLNLRPYFDDTEKSVDREFKGNEQFCEGVSYSYRFIRDTIQFLGKGSKLFFDVNGKYALKLNYCPKCTNILGTGDNCVTPRVYASCGVNEDMRELHVAYEMSVEIEKDFTIASQTKLRKVEALNPCEVTMFNYDATETLKEEIKKSLKSVEKDIDKELKAVDLRSEMEETWKLLQEPSDLDGYGYLYMHPKSISVGDIRFKGDTAYFTASLVAKPTIELSKSKMALKALPSLSKHVPKKGFDIVTDVYAPYDSLSSLITTNIAGTETEVGGKKIRFDEVEITSANRNQINLKVLFSGDKSGTIYLNGTPAFDAATQHLSFPDLQFDLKTKSALLKSAKWLFNSKITETLKEAASFDLNPYLDSLQSIVTQSLNTELTDGVNMKGKATKMDIRFIHPFSDKLHLRVHCEGKLEIEM